MRSGNGDGLHRQRSMSRRRRLRYRNRTLLQPNRHRRHDVHRRQRLHDGRQLSGGHVCSGNGDGLYRQRPMSRRRNVRHRNRALLEPEPPRRRDVHRRQRLHDGRQLPGRHVCSGTATICTASDQCHVAGVCDTATGLCSNPAAQTARRAPTATPARRPTPVRRARALRAQRRSVPPAINVTTPGRATPGPDSAPTRTRRRHDLHRRQRLHDGRYLPDRHCARANRVVCTASDQCHVAGTCDTGTGLCSNPAARTARRAPTATRVRRPTPAAGLCPGTNAGRLHGQRSMPRRRDVRSGYGRLLEPGGTRRNERATTATPARRPTPVRRALALGASPSSAPPAINVTSPAPAIRERASARTRRHRTARRANDSNACTQATPARPARATARTRRSAPPAINVTSPASAIRGRASARTRAAARRNDVQRRQRLHADRHLPGRRAPARTRSSARRAINATSPAPAIRGNRASARTPSGTGRHDVQRRQRLHADRHLPGRRCATGANPVVCTASDQCHVAGICDPGTGACSNPNARQRHERATTATRARRPTPVSRGRVHRRATRSSARPRSVPRRRHVRHRRPGVCSNPNAAERNERAATAMPAPRTTRARPACAAGSNLRAGVTCQRINATSRAPATRGRAPARIRPTANGTTCNDGNACTQTDTCQTGVCTGANSGDVHAPAISATSPARATRRPALCSNPNAANGTTCNDGNACTQTDTLSGRRVHRARTRSCARPAISATSPAPANRGRASAPTRRSPTAPTCNDGNACTQTDTCQAGACTGHNPVICTASDQCHVAGTCDTGDGRSARTRRRPNGTTCNDGRRLHADRHLPGRRVHRRKPGGLHRRAISATSPAPATRRPALCSNPRQPNGTACNDGNACTQTDTCQAGTCTGANPVTSARPAISATSPAPATRGRASARIRRQPTARRATTATPARRPTRARPARAPARIRSSARRSDQCHVAGICDPATGHLLEPNAPQTARRATTATPARGRHAARPARAAPGTRSVCTASDQCHVAGTCNTGTGTCSNPNAADGTTCNDGNACTQTDTCQAGRVLRARPGRSARPAISATSPASATPGTGRLLEPERSRRHDVQRRQRLHADRHLPGGRVHRPNPVVCTASDQCHVAGTCNPATGIVLEPERRERHDVQRRQRLHADRHLPGGRVHGSGIRYGLHGRAISATSPASATRRRASARTRTRRRRHDVQRRQRVHADRHLPGRHVCSRHEPGGLHGQRSMSRRRRVRPRDRHVLEPEPQRTARRATTATPARRPTPARPACARARVRSSARRAISATSPASATRRPGSARTRPPPTARRATTATPARRATRCQAGTCAPGTNPTVCTASDQCHVAGVCNPGTGLCSNPTAARRHDVQRRQRLHQTGDSVRPARARARNPVVCTASDQCHVAGTCNPATGTCSNPNRHDGTTCNDGNACTTGRHVPGRPCAPGTNPTICTASDQCHVAGTCDPGTGLCSNPTAANGTSCNDGDACTTGRHLPGRRVHAGTATVCTASDQCHVAGVCNTGTGVCSNPARRRRHDVQRRQRVHARRHLPGRTCAPGTATICTASDQCHVAGVCDTGTGLCSNPATADGTSCTDSDACTNGDTCQAGVCPGASDDLHRERSVPRGRHVRHGKRRVLEPTESERHKLQ